MKRVLTAAILVPVTVAVVLWVPGPAFALVVATVAVLAYREYAGLVSRHGIPAPGPLGYGAGLILLAAPAQAWLVATLLAAVTLTLAMRRRPLSAALPWAAATVLGALYIFGAWRSGLALREFDRWWLLFVLVINWVGDTAAYYAGRSLGKRKLAPEVSPAKTWEGAVASVLAALLVGWAYARLVWPGFQPSQVLVASLACNLAGQVGDLAESALKRGAGVKDSGNLLPGHGGCLDRTDGLLFSMPVIEGLLHLPGWR